jgi:hypothetical protein
MTTEENRGSSGQFSPLRAGYHEKSATPSDVAVFGLEFSGRGQCFSLPDDGIGLFLAPDVAGLFVELLLLHFAQKTFLLDLAPKSSERTLKIVVADFN